MVSVKGGVCIGVVQDGVGREQHWAVEEKLGEREHGGCSGVQVEEYAAVEGELLELAKRRIT